MHKNRFGDFITGTTGGTLTAYFALAALIVLFTGEALAFGPGLPIEASPNASLIGVLIVRILQTSYFAGLALMAFFGFRFMQELLRGRKAKDAMKEAATGPQFYF